MPRFEVDKEFKGSVEDAWKVVSAFGDCDWIPGVESCELEGEGVGAVRKLKLGAMEIHERLEVVDPATHTLSYSIVKGPMPTENYLATIRLSEPASGRVRVRWGAKFDVPGMDDEQASGLAKGIEGSYSSMADALGAAIA